MLAKIIDKIKLYELRKEKNHFKKLVRSIIGQQLSVKAAETIMNRFCALFGTRFPTPKEILKMDEEKIRACGISYSKIAYIKDLAMHVEEKKIDLKKIEKSGDEEIIEALTAIKGIGRWTAEMFLIFSLGREDVFSHGDLGLKNAIKKLYGLRKHPSPERARVISDKWKPYRSLASRYLWASLDNE